MTFEPGLAVRTRIKADRVVEFERWVNDVLASLADHLIDVPQVQWFREWSITEAAADAVEYLLLGVGSDLSALDLEPLLAQAYGAERGAAELARFEDMLSGEQDAWKLQPFDS